MEGEPRPIQTPEGEARALYGHILGARQKQHPFNFYLFQIASAKSSKSDRSILMLRYTVDPVSLEATGTQVPKYLTPEELLQEIKTYGAIDLGKFTRIDEAALEEASARLRAYVEKEVPAPETDQ